MILHIQVLRFVAAIAVVLHHSRPPIIPQVLFTDLPAWLNRLAGMGFAGVDLFFVISGAIMAETTRTLAPGPNTAFHFTATRFARIYSGWWPFFFLYLAANFLLGHVSQDKNLWASFFLWPQNLQHQLLPIVWTLCFELYFYVVLGALLLLSRKAMKVALIIWALAIFLFTAYQWANGLYAPPSFGEVTQLHSFYASPLVLEFVGGFFVCEFARRRPSTNWKPFALVGLLLISLATWYQMSGSLNASGMAGFHHVPERVLLIGGAACCLILCALLWKPPTGRLTLALAKLGDASYAMYLGHIAVIYGICVLLRSIGGGATQLPSSMLLFIIVIAVSIYSWLHYQWVERPLYLAVRSRLSNVISAQLPIHHA